VALDEHGKPVDVPQVIPETEDQKRRYAKAQIRREGRLRTRDELSKASG
jgi:acyl-CoA hydrolase